MAAVSEKDVGDRLDSINSLIGTVDGKAVNHYRYYPGRQDSSMMPCLIPFPTTDRRVKSSTTTIEQIRIWHIIALVAPTLEGLIDETAQRRAEALIPALYNLYDARPRLQYNDSGLAGVANAFAAGSTGPTVSPDGTLAIIRFNLEITTRGNI
jgi:hypothetical protein